MQLSDRQKRWVYTGAGVAAGVGGAVGGKFLSKTANRYKAIKIFKSAVNIRKDFRNRLMGEILSRVGTAPKRLKSARKGALDLREKMAGAVKLYQPTTATGKAIGPALFASGSMTLLGNQLRKSGQISETNVDRMMDQARAQRGPVGRPTGVSIRHVGGRSSVNLGSAPRFVGDEMYAPEVQDVVKRSTRRRR